MNMVAALLAGGSGERFWPWSRQAHPKQFLKLDGQTSLLTTSWRRLEAIFTAEQTLIVTQANQKDLVKIHLPDLTTQHLLLEPCARDTAAAILLTTLHVQQKFGDVVLGIFPSDHHIGDTATFTRAVHAACAQAQQGGIVTFGIQPTHAATGYGYIDHMPESLSENGFCVHEVRQFVEKPNAQRANEMLEAGHYLWNAGMFFFRTSVMLERFKTLQPALYAALAVSFSHQKTTLESFTESDNNSLTATYAQLPKISFDHAIMEKTQDVKVIPVNFDWDDLGDWTALNRVWNTDNVSIGEHLALETRGSIVVNQTPHLVVTLGLDDVVVVNCADVTLVMPKHRAQEVKQILQNLRGRSEYAGLI
jgi:mannose-1-phosphate guanylyltransferase